MAGRPRGSTSTVTKKKNTTSTGVAKRAVAQKSEEIESVQQITSQDIAASEQLVETTVNEVSKQNTVETAKKQYKVKKDLDLRSIVSVRNGYQGKLVYKSSRTGERYEWDAFGDEQDMELQELKNARNSSKAFFSNNWFLIDDPEIIEYLGVQSLYKKALSYDKFNDLFSMAPEEIERVVSSLSSGQKQTVAYRARKLIGDGEIDSIKVINALEKSLSIELIER